MDVIKIDQTFTAELGEDTRNSAILHAVITLADTLGITVTAEGVETAEQLRDLRMLRCADGQGYFFSPPATPDALATYLFGDIVASADRGGALRLILSCGSEESVPVGGGRGSGGA